MNITISNTAIHDNVVAAFFDSGCLNAWIPFEIASIPVKAAQPFAKAPSSRNKVRDCA